MSRKKTKKAKYPESERRSLSAHIIFCAIIFVITVVIYINTVHYPFQFDDLHRIRDNRHIRSFSALKQEYHFFKGQRFVVNFTLWMNYALGSKEPDETPTVEGMHIFNIMLHAINGMLVYFLALTLLGRYLQRTEVKRNSDEDVERNVTLFLKKYTAPLISMFAGLVFTLHPVQTESVTYIITRSEILAGFFCLASTLLYISLMPSRSMVSFIIKVIIISILYALAVESKEWALVMPLLFLVVDFIFLSWGNGKKFIKRANETGSVLLTTGIMAAIFIYNLKNTYRGDLDAGFSVTGITHGQYFLSQFNVLTYYIKLLFVPTNLRLDYDFPIMTSITQFPVFLAIPAVVILIVVGILTVKRSPILSFMILWFIVAIAPSAGAIPIADLIYEHRLYIAIAGFAVFAAYFIWRLLQMKGLSKLAYLPYLALITLTAVYGVGTINRNKVWSSVESLWDDAVAKAPNKARPHMNLGVRYMHIAEEMKDVSYFNKAEEHLKKAIELKSDSYDAFHNLGLVNQKKGENKIAPSENFTEARKSYGKAVELVAKTIEDIEARKKKEAKYDDALRTALEKQSNFFRKKAATLYHDLAVSYEYDDKGVRYGEGFNLNETVKAWDKSLQYEPDSEERTRNRIIALVFGGDIENAVASARGLISTGRSLNIATDFYASGFTLLKRENIRLALFFLEAALALEPSGANADAARKILDEMNRNNIN